VRSPRGTWSSSGWAGRARRSAPSPSVSTTSCAPPGLDTVYDDRDAGPGEKFADAELLGVPLRLTVGRRTLAAGEVEAQVRRGRETRAVPVDGAAEAAATLWRSLP
jgi:prolyl-tRNA synthetase